MAKGEMIRREDGRIFGKIVTRRLNEGFELVPNQNPVGRKPASHIIMARAPAGHLFEAGFAYQYQIERGDMRHHQGFNLLFNDPDYGEGFWLGAYPRDANNWDLSFKKETPEQSHETTAPAPADADDIAF